jgi:hypothetical protein
MSVRSDLGRRVELVSMDPWCHGISVGLYRREPGAVGVVHSYSSREGAGARMAFVAMALAVLGGLEPGADGGDHTVRIPCREWHNAAMKRLFLDCFRLDPEQPLAPRPLAAADTRSNQMITLVPLGRGAYRVDAEGASEGEVSRAPAIARALVRLAELEAIDETTVAFPCHWDHHELAGLMLVRAQNLRAALREEELSASRGVLTAPSAQE